MNMYIAIVGCRKYTNQSVISEHIKKFISSLNVSGNITIVSGGATGIDKCAKVFAFVNELEYIEYPANWTKYGRKAGPIRNAKIVEKSDYLLAFPSKTSVGTWNTISLAKRKGITTVIIEI